MTGGRLLAATIAAAGAGGFLTAVLQARSSDGFVREPLVVNDRALVNAWGLAASATGPWWVASEARDASTLYAGTGRKQALTVHVAGGPTGVVFNGGDGFVVHGGGRSAPARFIYACEDGAIRAWSPTVPTGWSTRAVTAVDSGPTGALYRGVALAHGRLYATDFHNARVVVYDSHWKRVVRRGAFVDRAIPAWYAPFGIAAFGDRVFVTYAGRAPVNGNDSRTGGYVDEFDLDGRLVAHVGVSSQLDEPWGMALAPRGFGAYSGALLVASFGTGRINAYVRQSGGWQLAGRLPVRVRGVWGIAFGTGGMSGSKTTLFYAAGPHTWRGASEAGVRGELGAIRVRG
jgi:uncharacterized protein (TIGR03118 family)